MWLELAAAAESDGFAGPRLAALPRYDAAMFGFVRKDPDNEVCPALCRMRMSCTSAHLCTRACDCLRLWHKSMGCLWALTACVCMSQKVVDLFGHDAVEEMIRLQSCDPAVLL